MKFSILFLVIFLIGCANTAKNLNDLSIGMDKDVVIHLLGEPRETRVSDGVEYMIYNLRTAPSADAQAGCGAAGVVTFGLAYLYKGCRISNDDYFIQLKQGNVTAYGRIGDFASIQIPEATINVHEPIKK
ncbi:MAG: hypothetical protein WB870_06905 [Gallionellaceae bacterium]